MDDAAPKLNANPKVISTYDEPELSPEEREFALLLDAVLRPCSAPVDAHERQPITPEEVFDLIRHIKDPEHPLSLEELNVVQLSGVHVDDAGSRVTLVFTPTVPHCSMSTLIGLCLRVRLLRSLPPRFKVDIFVEPGSHVSESQVNKQLNDKERVAAALENAQLVNVVNKSLVDSL